MKSLFSNIKDLFTKSTFSRISKFTNKSNYEQEGYYHEDRDYYYYSDGDSDGNYDSVTVLLFMVISIAIFILAFMAVPNICPDNSERGKNTRLGLYGLLLLSGGRVGIFYIIMSMAKLNICI